SAGPEVRDSAAPRAQSFRAHRRGAAANRDSRDGGGHNHKPRAAPGGWSGGSAARPRSLTLDGWLSDGWPVGIARSLLAVLDDWLNLTDVELARKLEGLEISWSELDAGLNQTVAEWLDARGEPHPADLIEAHAALAAELQAVLAEDLPPPARGVRQGSQSRCRAARPTAHHWAASRGWASGAYARTFHACRAASRWTSQPWVYQQAGAGTSWAFSHETTACRSQERRNLRGWA
ncbi:MAG: hypothetical protein ACYDD0_08850, partial [Candidatus Dormibacteria bacterium]